MSIRSELSVLRSGRLWLTLACAGTTGGVLSAYSYLAPLLSGRAGVGAGLVPLVLAGFGIGALAGSVLGGRFGDRRPYATTIAAPALTAIILLAMCLLSAHAMPTVALVSLLGLLGLGANPVLISLAVRFASQAPILGSALCVSAFNVGTAFGTWPSFLPSCWPAALAAPQSRSPRMQAAAISLALKASWPPASPEPTS
jgi:DHA1 family inner membrane transport protein